MSLSIELVRGDALVRAMEWDPGSVVSLDTETTGLDPGRDSVLSLSIVDGDLDTVFDSLVHTYRKGRWPSAQRVNGINPMMVRDSPSVPQIRGEVHDILASADVVVGYNLYRFDIPMMEGDGFDLPDMAVYDAYLAFVDSYPGNPNHSLSACAGMFGIGFEPHRSLEDARAALLCALRLAGGPE